ncbi:hypothetical protein HDU96_007607 [Phlyctochytrium bullatum]|nr:hypothetical protein HDU96_007607 [Phlyctochytrium bullatum]
MSEHGRFGHELYLSGYPQSIRDTPATPRDVGRRIAATPGPRWLVVGRGFSGGWWGSASITRNGDGRYEGSPAVVVGCDHFGGAFKNPETDSPSTSSGPEEPPLHLWMNFNLPTSLAELPSALFDRILIDWSTWRYLKPLMSLPQPSPTLLLDEWCRLLRPGGDLCFESGIASVTVFPTDGCGATPFCDHNPAHVVVPSDTAKELLVRNGGWRGGAAKARTANPMLRVAGLAAGDGDAVDEVVKALVRAGKVVVPAPAKPGTAKLLAEKSALERAAQVVVEGVSEVVEGRLLEMFRGGWQSAEVVVEKDGDGSFPIEVRGSVPRWIRAVKDSVST